MPPPSTATGTVAARRDRTAIKDQVRRLHGCRFDHRGVQEVGQLVQVVAVGPGDQTDDGKALALAQQLTFRAEFALVGRVASRGFCLARPPFCRREP
jgi:hypothetical protein